MRDVWKVGLLYTVYTPIGGKGRCSTRYYPQVHCTQASKCAGERTMVHPGFETPWGGSHEVQNRGNQWAHKMDLGPTKILKKRSKVFQAKDQSTRNIEFFVASCLSSWCFPVEVWCATVWISLKSVDFNMEVRRFRLWNLQIFNIECTESVDFMWNLHTWGLGLSSSKVFRKKDQSTRTA